MIDHARTRCFTGFALAAGFGALTGCASVPESSVSKQGGYTEQVAPQPALTHALEPTHRLRTSPSQDAAGADARALASRPTVNARAYADMYFKHYGVNPTIETEEQNFSTFAVDVDTAAYTLARAYLADGNLPESEAIRVEEFVNAFDYGYRPPLAGSHSPLAIQAELFPSPNRPGFSVLHVGLKGRAVSRANRKPANLVFVIDVSGSMGSGGRLDAVKQALHALVDQLDARDRVAVVAYSTRARVEVPSTGISGARGIRAGIDRLRPEGSTNASAGLALGYQVAGSAYLPGGVNRVILCSDGVANEGVTGTDGILNLIDGARASGIGLTAVGVGLGNYNDVLLEQLANRANGSYHYIDRPDEAMRLFVSQMTGTLQTIARDVKVQVDFDPRAVARYRLLGYENRALEQEDFADDSVDAGEIGAGHSVTALYEVKLTERAHVTGIGHVRLRYQPPGGGRSQQFERRIAPQVIRHSFETASAPARLSVIVAGFAEKLRGSYWVRTLSYEALLRQLGTLPWPLREDASVRELAQMIVMAQQLDRRGDRFESEMPIAVMSYDHVPVLR